MKYSNSNRIMEMFYVNGALSGLVLTKVSTQLHGATTVIVTHAGLVASPSKVSLTDRFC